MNTSTTQEAAAIAAGADLITLPPAQRAAVALESSKVEADLRALVARSATITAVLDPAGREQAHRAAMDLKNARVAITNTGKKAREDATAFSNAVIAEEKRLAAISTPEETRLFALRDGWDAKVAAEKAEKERQERARVQAISDAIDALRRNETEAARCRTAAEIKALVDQLEAHTITDAIYQERKGEAELVKAEVLVTLQSLHAARVEAEAAELRAKQEREAEAARLAEERAELARLRAEAAERDRVAAETKRQLEAQAAQIAAERRAVEEERAAIAALEDRGRLADLADAMTETMERAAITGTGALRVSVDEGGVTAEPVCFAPTSSPTLRLGQITERLGFTITADFLASLGFAHSETDKAAKLYHESEYPLICRALIRHIESKMAVLEAA